MGKAYSWVTELEKFQKRQLEQQAERPWLPQSLVLFFLSPAWGKARSRPAGGVHNEPNP